MSLQTGSLPQSAHLSSRRPSLTRRRRRLTPSMGGPPVQRYSPRGRFTPGFLSRRTRWKWEVSRPNCQRAPTTRSRLVRHGDRPRRWINSDRELEQDNCSLKSAAEKDQSQSGEDMEKDSTPPPWSPEKKPGAEGRGVFLAPWMQNKGVLWAPSPTGTW